ncbi:Uncharacterised protein [uncultured archaeon]|nr:Uncharacterised protein [uncultured archaeon]
MINLFCQPYLRGKPSSWARRIRDRAGSGCAFGREWNLWVFRRISIKYNTLGSKLTAESAKNAKKLLLFFATFASFAVIGVHENLIKIPDGHKAPHIAAPPGLTDTGRAVLIGGGGCTCIANL